MTSSERETAVKTAKKRVKQCAKVQRQEGQGLLTLQAGSHRQNGATATGSDTGGESSRTTKWKEVKSKTENLSIRPECLSAKAWKSK